jgi:hypothetical protein
VGCDTDNNLDAWFAAFAEFDDSGVACDMDGDLDSWFGAAELVSSRVSCHLSSRGRLEAAFRASGESRVTFTAFKHARTIGGLVAITSFS